MMRLFGTVVSNKFPSVITYIVTTEIFVTLFDNHGMLFQKTFILKSYFRTKIGIFWRKLIRVSSIVLICTELYELLQCFQSKEMVPFLSFYKANFKKARILLNSERRK